MKTLSTCILLLACPHVDSLRRLKTHLQNSDDVLVNVRADQLSLAHCGDKMVLVSRRQDNCKNLKDLLFVDLPTRQEMRKAWTHSYYHNGFRLQRALQKLGTTNDTFNILVIGGSITAGVGCSKNNNWATLLRDYLNSTFGNRVVTTNLAISGSHPSTVTDRWMTNLHLLKTADIIIAEYNFNDMFNMGHKYGSEELVYRTNDLLVHMVFELPNEPAFLYLDLQGSAKRRQQRFHQNYIKVEQSMHYKIAKACHIPIIWFGELERQVGHDIWGPEEHPGCSTHNSMAQLIYRMFQETLENVCMNGVTGIDTPLPKLTETAEKKCVTQPALSIFASVGEDTYPVQAGEWLFKEDVPGKPGWIAPPGSPKEIVLPDIPIKQGGLQIEYLQTYENIGRLTCTLEQNKQEVRTFVLDGKWNYCASLQTTFSSFGLTPGNYDLRCLSDGEKFKITGFQTC